MNIESMLRNVIAKDPAAFRRALAALGFAPRLAKDAKRSFSQELRRRFACPEAVLRKLGLDSALLDGIHREKSKSVLDDDHAREIMGQHGHAGHGSDDEEEFDARLAEMLKEKGISEDDVHGLMDMVHDHIHSIQGGEHHHHHHHAGMDDEESERRLESRGNMEKSATNYPKRDERRAEMTEHRNSVQNEDHDLPRNARRGGMGGRLAGDELAFLDEVFERLPASGGRCLTRAELRAEAEARRYRNPAAAMAHDDRKRQRDESLFEFIPDAKRIGFSL